MRLRGGPEELGAEDQLAGRRRVVVSVPLFRTQSDGFSWIDSEGCSLPVFLVMRLLLDEARLFLGKDYTVST